MRNDGFGAPCGQVVARPPLRFSAAATESALSTHVLTTIRCRPFSRCARYIVPCPSPGIVDIGQDGCSSSQAYFPLSFPSYWTKNLHGCTLFDVLVAHFIVVTMQPATATAASRGACHGMLPRGLPSPIAPPRHVRWLCPRHLPCGSPRQYTMALAMGVITVCRERNPTACHGKPHGMPCQPVATHVTNPTRV